MKASIQNPRLLILNEAGEYEIAEAVFENGYLIYETDRLGQFVVIGDLREQEPNDTEVKGNYYSSNHVGGALTGDETNVMIFMGMECISFGLLLLIAFKRKQKEGRG